MSAIKEILFLFGFAYTAFLLLIFFSQAKLIYYPDSNIIVTPAAVGLDYESVAINTSDGVKLHGWFLPSQPRRGVLAFFHGNAGNISHRLDSLKIFHQLGLSVLIVDYRGYGLSEGEPSEQGTYLDARAVWDYLTMQRGVAARDIVIFGRSLGAAIATHLASHQKPGSLILESAFTSVPDMAAKLYPFLPVRWLVHFSYDTREYLTTVTCPVLIIHSPQDDIVPFEFGEALFATAQEPKQFLQIRGGHNDGFLVSGEDYSDGLEAFLAAHFDRDAMH